MLGHVQNPLQCERIQDVGSGFVKKRTDMQNSRTDMVLFVGFKRFA